ncbi:hypothetical protein F66182_8140 [Fusarium sp. NRRL 66182]|nr:hypothetical protein F66182_8140 [Fusarium sp. NRRL 66182]
MSHLERSLKSSSVAETLGTYDEWAKTYNQDVEREEYVAPQLAADELAKYVGSHMADARILDAGCGTGLVGECLAKHGAKQLDDGLDLSPGMLQVAERTGVYNSLNVANLAERLKVSCQFYDAVICVGTMTEGHLGPEAFDELVRVTKPGGFIISTVRESVWETKGYKDKVDALNEAGKTKTVSNHVGNQRIGAGIRAYFVILQVQ